MELAKVMAKGQVTIPINVRRKLNLKEGDKLIFVEKDGNIVIANSAMIAIQQVQTAFEGEAERLGLKTEQNASYPYKLGSNLYANFGDLLSLAEQVMDSLRGEVEDLDVLLKELESKFGARISVKGYDNNKANIDAIGASTIEPGNVIIAPNILEKMASDPKSRQFYEQKIQAHFDTIPEANAFMAVHGRQIVARGVIIHPDEKVTYYSKSDYTPQEKARLEKARKRAEEKRLDELACLRYWERIHAQQFTVGSSGLETSSIHVHSSFLGPMQLRR